MSGSELPNPKELEEVRERGFTSRVAMVTALFAVILAISSLGGNRAMKEMLLAQQQASDQWAYYQAKSIREHLYKSQATLLENELGVLSEALNSPSAEKLSTSIKALDDQAERYAREKNEIEQEARKLEKERDIARAKDPYFEFGGVLLEIAIVMASVAIIALSRSLFVFSLAVASLGAFLTLDGYMQFFELPFLR